MVPGLGLGVRYLPGTGAGGVCFSLLLSSVSLPSETPVGEETGLGGQANAPHYPKERYGEALEWKTSTTMLPGGPEGSSQGEFPALGRTANAVAAALERHPGLLGAFHLELCQAPTWFSPQSGPNNNSRPGLLPQESIQDKASEGLLKQLQICE